MRRVLFGILLAAFLTACTAENTSRPDQGVPSAVTAAFSASHPYAKIDRFTKHDMPDGSVQYEVQYDRTDGSKGTAVYTPSGESISDQ